MTIERSFLLVKPDGVLGGQVKDAREALVDAGLKIVDQRRIRLTAGQVRRLYPERASGRFAQENEDYMTAGDVVMISVEGTDAVDRTSEVKGKTYKSGLRKVFADNFVHNTFHSPDRGEVKREEEVIKNES